ncbi:MAG: alpha/beta hydrolase [Enterococcus sp.]
MIHEKIAIDHARLTTYMLENFTEIAPNRTRPVVIICPGGGYEKVSPREGEAVAIRMNSFGFHACILEYSIAPNRYPTALIELAKAVKYLRQHSTEWHVDPDKIIVAGFSAGGHLAGNLGVAWNNELLKEEVSGEATLWKPNALLLCYPVISSGEFAHQGSFNALLGDTKESNLKRSLSLETQVTPATPPTFIWHTVSDAAVPVENTLLFANALQKNNIPFELHLFPKGEHGLSLATEETSLDSSKQNEAVSKWPELFELWVKNCL